MRRGLLLCARLLRTRRDLQLSAQIRTVILKKVEIKHSSVDVAPTLGVNHVISGVVVLVMFLLCLSFMH